MQQYIGECDRGSKIGFSRPFLLFSSSLLSPLLFLFQEKVVNLIALASIKGENLGKFHVMHKLSFFWK
jgi:hypothetical protein